MRHGKGHLGPTGDKKKSNLGRLSLPELSGMSYDVSCSCSLPARPLVPKIEPGAKPRGIITMQLFTAALIDMQLPEGQAV